MIVIRDLYREYKTGDTEVHALQGISLDIDQGEFLSVAGPSGSGKTTFLNLVGCIDIADKGTITIDGFEVTSIPHEKLAGFRREKLGFIFQSFNLIPVLTAYENVALPLHLLKTPEKEIKDRVMGLLQEVGLAGMEHRRPNKLSGGQQQRVAIARALIKKPAIILADEPTANLDSDTSREILKLMKEMNNKYKNTFIFSTHDPMVIDYAQRAVLLKDGLIQSDTRSKT